MLRRPLASWVFGCDICQMVCPWNRFASPQGDPAFHPGQTSHPQLITELEITPAEFNRRFERSPIRRAKRRGYLRNVSVALGNTGRARDLPALQQALDDPEPMVREHAAWAIREIEQREAEAGSR